MELLTAGIPVLCEKPLAPTVEEATTCCEAAERSGVLLAVGMVRRFHSSTILMKRVLDDGFLGSVSRYEWDLGVPYNWDTASGFYFYRQQSGGGVLLDEGVHDLDLLTHWFGSVKAFKCQADDWGSGVESNVILTLEHADHKGDLTGQLRLSRTYTLKNRLLICGTQGKAEILRADPTSVLIQRDVAGQQVNMTLRLPSASCHEDPFFAQLDNFLTAVQGRATAAVSGRQALATIDLIQRCYSEATRIREPWLEIPGKLNGSGNELSR
jgi:predicted dehydrogenase